MKLDLVFCRKFDVDQEIVDALSLITLELYNFAMLWMVNHGTITRKILQCCKITKLATLWLLFGEKYHFFSNQLCLNNKPF